MPFDSSNYQPNDEVLRVLQDARVALEASWSQLCGGGDRVGDGGCINHQIVEATDRKVVGPVHLQAIEIVGRCLPVPSSMCGDVFAYNDTHSHAEVLALMDRAIAARTAELNGALTEAR